MPQDEASNESRALPKPTNPLGFCISTQSTPGWSSRFLLKYDSVLTTKNLLYRANTASAPSGLRYRVNFTSYLIAVIVLTICQRNGVDQCDQQHLGA